ncbi:unnamed protein product [Phytophthora fragariaefolia]|uniref:Unnamed protein product n=1 Tax=Phytophthora fragariaefolia TaxID=1490495 RepID=A0A9W6XKN3_9STRA|nr:unnamed protein product [Phytophthora fragariaefolia]
MARDNGKYHLKHKLSDFDAVSLYPSAMSELPGYVRGKGKLFKDSIPSDADYYVARVRFDSINIKRHFPHLSFYENGSRNFANDIIGRTMIVGKQALEDIVGFIGADKLYRKAKAFDKNITKKNVSEWHKRQQSIQQFSSRSKRFPQFKIASNNPNEWQMDLAFWEKQPILISVNINSRIGFAKLLNNKRAETVLKAIEDFVGKNEVSAIFSDNGSEFINTYVESFFDERSISHGNAIAGDHTVLGKIDRFIRTIKSKLTKMKQIIRFKKLTQSILNEAIANYNNTHHSAINATPSEMRGKVMLDDVEYNKGLVKKNYYRHPTRIDSEISLESKNSIR